MTLLEHPRSKEPPLSYAERAGQAGAARDVLRTVGIQRIDGNLTGPTATDVELAQQFGSIIQDVSVGHIIYLESKGIEFPDLEKPEPQLTSLPLLVGRQLVARVGYVLGRPS
jgi:hypothetical protein